MKNISKFYKKYNINWKDHENSKFIDDLILMNHKISVLKVKMKKVIKQ